MNKDGNWFTLDMDLEKNSLYKFVVDGNWMVDSLNKNVYLSDADNSYINIATATTNVDSSIYMYSSDHFDYFTTKQVDSTGVLENTYTSLMSVLDFVDPKMSTAKMRYYGIDYVSNSNQSMFSLEVPFATPKSNEVYDLWDCNSSHEMIHNLVQIKNSFFNEGIAQCFQKEGNITLKEQNPTLSEQYLISKSGSSGFITQLTQYIKSTPTNYYAPASFIYYNVYTKNKREQFGTFLKNLTYTDTITTISTKYSTTMGTELKTDVSEWESWVKSVNKDSDIYVSW